MTRYTIFMAAALGFATAAVAAMAPIGSDYGLNGQNQTVIEKNQAFPMVGPLTVVECNNEDCSPARS